MIFQKLILRDDPNNRYGHEPELCHLLDMLLKNDDTFLDIGSASGYFWFTYLHEMDFQANVLLLNHKNKCLIL